MKSAWGMLKLILPAAAVGYFGGKCIQMLPLKWQAYVGATIAAFCFSWCVTSLRQMREMHLKLLNAQAELRMRLREEIEREP